MDRLEAMSIVLAVAEAGSLSAAARQQKKPLATVSRKVTELEAQLQTKLFHRSSRALVPTDAGRSYIAASKRILDDVAEAERAASGGTQPRAETFLSRPHSPSVACICYRLWRRSWRRFGTLMFNSVCRIEQSIFSKSTSMSPFALVRLPIAASSQCDLERFVALSVQALRT